MSQLQTLILCAENSNSSQCALHCCLTTILEHCPNCQHYVTKTVDPARLVLLLYFYGAVFLLWLLRSVDDSSPKRLVQAERSGPGTNPCYLRMLYDTFYGLVTHVTGRAEFCYKCSSLLKKQTPFSITEVISKRKSSV